MAQLRKKKFKNTLENQTYFRKVSNKIKMKLQCIDSLKTETLLEKMGNKRQTE